MTPTQTIFIPLFTAATALFIWSCWKRLSLTALGRPENRLDNIGQRIGVTGSRGYIPEFRRAHVTAGRVSPLNERLIR